MSKYKYFSSCPENGVSFHETQQQALDFANENIRTHLHDAWSDNVEEIVVGIITHQSTAGEREYPTGKIDEDGVDEEGIYWSGDYDYRVGYTMQLSAENKNLFFKVFDTKYGQVLAVRSTDWDGARPVIKFFWLDSGGNTIEHTKFEETGIEMTFDQLDDGIVSDYIGRCIERIINCRNK